MRHLVLLSRRSSRLLLAVLAILVVTTRAEAQGIGFQGGATVDPEQMFVGTYYETKDFFQGLRFRPGIDGSWGGGEPALAAINIEFTFHTPLGRSSWSMYQGGGPAIVLVRQPQYGSVDVSAGSFFTFGFAHDSGFFSEFKYGGGRYPSLKFGAGFTIRKKKP